MTSALDRSRATPASFPTTRAAHESTERLNVTTCCGIRCVGFFNGVSVTKRAHVEAR